MSEQIILLSLVMIILAYGYYSKLLYKLNISGPMVFTLIGICFAPFLKSEELFKHYGKVIEFIAEFALVIVLFDDASSLKLKEMREDWSIPARLLGIGLPLTILFALGGAWLFFEDVPITYLLLLSLILAPTDAALGKAVVTDPIVPEKIRSSINVESGLNDGIVFPLFITVVVAITNISHASENSHWIIFLVKQISFGVIIGSIVGYLGSLFANRAIKKEWMEESYKNLIPVALAILAYLAAEPLGGNGFISSFFAGFVVGNQSTVLRKKVEIFSESEGEILILVSFVLFGILFLPISVAYWDMKILLFSIMSLTIFRMIPVAISLIGSKLDKKTVLFIGWFGPRGIASILYTLIAVHKIGNIKGHEEIYATISLTIVLSIVLHGISAKPLAKLYSKG